MNILHTIKGNLLTLFGQLNFDVMIHGCNAYHAMDGGIAAQISKVYPGAANVDIVQSKRGDPGKLGKFTFFHPNNRQTIINAYTQYQPGPDANLGTIRDAFERLADSPLIEGKKVGIPMIGAGIGGLKWEDVEQVIYDSGIDDVCDLTIVEFG